MNLPIRYAYFPKPLHDAFGELIPNKESITCWLWAKPQLLGWRLNIHWLWFSSGSLYGLDSTGSLIIVRLVTDAATAPDPFEKSVADIKNTAMNRYWSAEALRTKWIKNCASIDSLSCSGGYYRRVKRSLDLREASGNPSPVFFGLIASSRPDFRLSRKARKNLVYIQSHVGAERAGVRVISARVSRMRIRVRCRTL
jgi:hypothetical protein